MTIHWSLLGPGVLLLLFPADRLLSSQVKLRSFESFQNLENSSRRRPWWWVPALWLDPARGLGGALLVRHGLNLSSVTWELTPKPAYVLMLAILGAGVVSQTLTRRDDASALLAPVGFVAGLVGGLTPWPVALVAAVSGVMGIFGIRHFQGFFLGGLSGVCLFGGLLGADLTWIAAAAFLHALPLGMRLVTGRTLEVPTWKEAEPSTRDAGPL